MNYVKDGNQVIVGLKKGDEIFTELYKIAKKEHWRAAQITGIGAIKTIEMGYLDPAIQDYQRQTFDDTYELISLTGNLTIKDQQPFLHLHCCIADTEYRCFGGHLFSAEVAVVAEINITLLNTTIERRLDPNIGIACCHFEGTN